MPKAKLNDLVAYLRTVFPDPAARDLTDAELLQRFLKHREDTAFSLLVQRHGPMVLSVCRRLLGDSHSAEDSMQATFLVLVRRAASIRSTRSIASWLHGVAQRIALKTRAQIKVRQKREMPLVDEPAVMPRNDIGWQEMYGVLDEEIGRLPEKYRAPVVLCYFEDKSYDQAAKELGWSKSSLAKRLTRARELLRQQLVRQGVAISGGVLAMLLCDKVSGAHLPAMLTIKTVKAAALVATGKSAAGGCLSTGALALAEEAMVGMVTGKAKSVLVVLALGLAIGAAGWVSYGRLGERAASVPQAPVAQETAGALAKKKGPALDQYGDPLPQGAVARLGSARFRGMALALAFSRDAKILASAGGDLGVSLWEAATGRLLHRLPLPGSCNSLAIAADGKSFVAGGDIPCLIDMETGKKVREFKLPAGCSEWCVALSPDGRTLAAGSGSVNNGSATVVLLDVATGQLKRRLRDFRGGVRTVAFSPDGKLLA
jgi:RNA polymerase sigma factor (sigma-70 family)